MAISTDIIREHENIGDIRKKLDEREKEDVKKAFAKRNVDSMEGLKDASAHALKQRTARTTHEPLKDRTVLTTPTQTSTSSEVSEIKENFMKEVGELARRALQLPQDLSGLEKKVIGDLKGRIQKGPPGAAGA